MGWAGATCTVAITRRLSTPSISAVRVLQRG